MKKLLLSTLLLIPTIIPAIAQEPQKPQKPQELQGQQEPQKLTVTYKGTWNLLEEGLEFIAFEHFVDINLGGKRTLKRLTGVVCRGGETTEKELMPEWLIAKNVSKIRFFAQSATADSVQISITTDGEGNIPPHKTYLPDHKDNMLLETYDAGSGTIAKDEEGELSVEYPLDAPVPLIAYTTGLEASSDIDDVEFSGGDYFGLRDKHEHPSLWHEKYGIDNYVYYIAEFE